MRKIHKQSCTAFRKLMCVRTQRSSEEAFWFFGKNFPILGRSLLVCGGVALQTHFGKAFRIAASILKMRTIYIHPHRATPNPQSSRQSLFAAKTKLSFRTTWHCFLFHQSMWTNRNWMPRVGGPIIHVRMYQIRSSEWYTGYGIDVY